jgi:hypothetical protein
MLIGRRPAQGEEVTTTHDKTELIKLQLTKSARNRYRKKTKKTDIRRQSSTLIVWTANTDTREINKIK